MLASSSCCGAFINSGLPPSARATLCGACTKTQVRSQVWKEGEKVDELVGAAKDRLKELVERHASVPVAA